MRNELQEANTKLQDIERILLEFLIATPTHEVTKDIVMRIQAVTGDETFVMNPVNLNIYA
jgi:hypothetical protein